VPVFNSAVLHQIYLLSQNSDLLTHENRSSFFTTIDKILDNHKWKHKHFSNICYT